MRVGRSFVARRREAERVGDPAHEIGVADLAEVARVARRRRGVLDGAERRAPDLERVDARRLGDGAEDRHRPVGEQAVAVAAERARDLLADQVVREEQVLALVAPVVDVEHVFAVRRLELALELEVLVGSLEELVVAALQVVAAGEDDAVVLGELVAGQADGVDADDALRARVEHEVAVLLLAERLHAQEDERADLRPRDVGVVERLVRVVDRLAVDAAAVLGVVLDLDREVAADRLDEDGVEDVDVRVRARDLVFAARGRPLEVVLLRRLASPRRRARPCT